MFEILKSYVAAYGNLTTFLCHKAVHIAVGGLVAIAVLGMTGSLILGALAAVLVGIVKEVSDQLQTWNTDRIPLVYSLFDVVITSCGSVAMLATNGNTSAVVAGTVTGLLAVVVTALTILGNR